MQPCVRLQIPWSKGDLGYFLKWGFLVQVNGIRLSSPACACPREVEEHHWAHIAGEVWDD